MSDEQSTKVDVIGMSQAELDETVDRMINQVEASAYRYEFNPGALVKVFSELQEQVEKEFPVPQPKMREERNTNPTRRERRKEQREEAKILRAWIRRMKKSK